MNGLLPTAVFEIPRDGDDHDVHFLRKELPPARTVLQIDKELIEVCRSAVHDDEPGILVRIRIQAGELKAGDVPIHVVAFVAFDGPLGLIAELFSRDLCQVARIESSSGRCRREIGNCLPAIG